MILAAQLADGDVIDAEHLFFGPGGGTEAAQADLSGWPWLEQHLRSGKALIALRVFVGLFFASIVVACGLSPDTMFGWWANLLTWGVWWPVLVVSLLVLGRVWCAVCPLAGVGELAQKLGGRGIDPPDWLKHWAPSVTLVGFVAIIWVEQVTHMTEYPQHTSVFLLTLALLAVVFSWLLQRHAWCRYLCPLGAMGAVFSVASTLRVRAQREVCGGQCVGNECYKGSDVAQGCPMFTHALFRTHGQHCKLCMECLRSCPTGSPRLILQPPLRDIWGSDLIAADMAPLAVVVGMMAMVMAATTANSVTPEMARWLFSGGSAASVVLGLALTAFLRQRQKTSGSRDVGWVARAIYAFVPAIAALMFAFHLRSIPWLPDMLFRFGTPSGDVVGFSLLHFGQWTGAVLGAGMTLWALWPICRMRFEPGESVKSGGAWIALSGLALSSLTLGILWLG
ncbi:MAG TPA: 4Fe-4S binding protein, partial [Armatimonadota bacterium]|nr:4Fe-4S binding protein [Armatimonadota bacterium]